MKAKYSIILVLAGLLGSCTEVLDTKPGSLTLDTYYSNSNDYLQVIIGAYGKMIDIYSFNNNTPITQFWALPGDDVTLGDNLRTSSGQNSFPFETFNGITATSVEIDFFYRSGYQIIKRTNNVLEALEAKGHLLSEDERNNLKGEALFLRSLWYYKLWNYFGTSPLLTQSISSIYNTESPNSQALQILDQVITDLETSAELLPAEWPANFIGRANQNSANGFLVKAYCTRACFKKGSGDETGAQSDYALAIEAGGRISGVELNTDYAQNFSGAFENNPESLFELQASQDPSFENLWLNNDFGYQSATAGTCYCNYDPNTPMGTIYWACTPFFPTQKLIEALTDDPRKSSIIAEATGNTHLFQTGYVFVKYLQDVNDPGLWAGSNSSSNNQRLLRLADVKLLMAEALVQTGHPAEAIQEINDIRERAWGDNSHNRNSSETNVSTIMQWIMDERFVELAAEDGIRWLDLRRWHKAGYIDLTTWESGTTGFSSYRPATDFTFSSWYSEHNGEMLYPIPSDEIVANSLLIQNTGY